MAGEAKLGTIPNERSERDAVHVAVLPCIASERLMPGQRVGESGRYASTADSVKIGIVDPFLLGPIEPGTWFYVCLDPGTVIGMRHHWRHPAIDPPMCEDEEWLRDYAFKANIYDTPEEAFINLMHGLRTGELFFNGTDLHGFGELPEPDELKRRAEKFLGITIDWGRFSFSCSC